PAPDNPYPQSDFLRVTGTLAGYIRLSEKGLALAVSVKGGRILELKRYCLTVPGESTGSTRQVCSQTYPDRFFFLGGVDSLRGFLQDSLVPEDIAGEILSASNRALPAGQQFTIDQVTIRGGNIFINPRVELRIPITGIWETGIFLDAGNTWLDPAKFNPFV